jgi:glucose-6-phosphate 1-dehydrogenase
VDGKAVPGYLDEVKVPAGSHCETFVALRTEVQNWRWAGVPFYLRTGKRLAGARRADRRQLPRGAAPHLPGHTRANKLVIKLQPEDGLELHLLAAKGGGAWRGAGAGQAGPGLRQGLPQRARGRLRAPAARRDRRPAEPVRAQRRAGAGLALGRAHPARPGPPTRAGPRPYAAGSWGPAAASAMVARDGCTWAEEV